MPVIAIQGIRGGVGTTSVAAGLAWSLQELGESVLAIDLSPNNMLRLYFNTPFERPRGWAHSFIDETPWEESALRYTPLLDFVPFGSIPLSELPRVEQQLQQNPSFWQKHIETLSNRYQWIVLDVPSNNLIKNNLIRTQHTICVMTPDMNSHIRLHQQELPKSCHFLINQFNPSSLLQRDLRLTWSQSLTNMLPFLIPHDEGMAEALATKQPVGEYAPEHLSSKEITTLANWCLLNFKEKIS